MDVDSPIQVEDASEGILDTVEGETQFFKALLRSRPVGIDRHFHVMTMQAAIERGVNQKVSIDEIWRKLESCYNLEALENLEVENEASTEGTPSSTPQPVSSPKEDDHLPSHPWFRSEFNLPRDAFVESLLAERRVRSSPSPPSSPSRNTSPAAAKEKEPQVRRGKRRASRATMAGLVSGDSDSSDLTQQSADDKEEEGGEEGATPSDRRTSVATASEGESEEEQEDDTRSKTRRGRRASNVRRGRAGLRRRKR